MLKLQDCLLAGHKPTSHKEAVRLLFDELYRRAPQRLTFDPSWKGERDTLKPLAKTAIQDLGITLGRIGATQDDRGRRILVIPISMGHIVVREVDSSKDEFKSWPSPQAESLEGMSRNNVDMDFILQGVAYSGWPANQ